MRLWYQMSNFQIYIKGSISILRINVTGDITLTYMPEDLADD